MILGFDFFWFFDILTPAITTARGFACYSLFLFPHFLLPISLCLRSYFAWLIQAGKQRAEERHKFMEAFLQQFQGEWEGKL